LINRIYYHPLSLLSWNCWVPTQQRERMVVNPVNQYQKL